MPGQKFETKQRITVRNLRIREDTAKVCIIVLHALLITSITVFYVCMIYTSDIRHAYTYKVVNIWHNCFFNSARFILRPQTYS